MTRRIPLPFPDPALGGARAEAVVRGWEALLSRSPGLRPWVAEVLASQRRTLRAEPPDAVEEQLWTQLERWLRAFDALPHFAASAIATTLGEEERPARSWEPREEAPATEDSPEAALTGQETLFEDPAFALAAHCVDARITPVLPAAVPRGVLFGLLRASAGQEPTLTARTAVLLVLRYRGEELGNLPTRSRNAALRLFCASPADLRAAEELAAHLPSGWPAPAEFVTAAVRSRRALEDACALCARLATAALRAGRGQPLGGLVHLFDEKAAPTTPAEVVELCRAAANHPPSSGLRRLVSSL